MENFEKANLDLITKTKGELIKIFNEWLDETLPSLCSSEKGEHILNNRSPIESILELTLLKVFITEIFGGGFISLGSEDNKIEYAVELIDYSWSIFTHTNQWEINPIMPLKDHKIKNHRFLLQHVPQFKIETKKGKYYLDFLFELYIDTTISDYSYQKHKGGKILTPFVTLGIELEGHAFHEKTKRQAEYDKIRDREIMKLGYEIFHYTGSEMYNNSEQIIKEILYYLLEKSRMKLED